MSIFQADFCHAERVGIGTTSNQKRHEDEGVVKCGRPQGSLLPGCREPFDKGEMGIGFSELQTARKQGTHRAPDVTKRSCTHVRQETLF